jgi:predicted phage tail protein
MAQKAGHSDTPASTAAKQVQTELSKLGETQTEAMLAMQKDLLDTYEQISGAWLERVKAEADLWSELASKISAVRSLPDALNAYQQGVAQRVQMAADDGRRLFEDTQKIVNTMTRSLSGRWPTGAT